MTEEEAAAYEQVCIHLFNVSQYFTLLICIITESRSSDLYPNARMGWASQGIYDAC